MDNNKKICKLYFIDELDTVKIAEKLKITKQAVSKVLKNQWPEEYEAEKQSRMKERKIHREERRKMEVSSEDIECLLIQHDSEIGMSNARRLTDKGIVFCCLSSFDVNKNRDKLVYNNAFGRRPKDLPPSLKLNVYR